MRKLIRKILKEDFDWVTNVIKKEYPIKLEVLIDYFGYDGINPDESLDSLDNHGRLECYDLFEGGDTWCVGTVDESYNELRDYYYRTAEDGDTWDLSDYTTISEDDVSNFIENEPIEYIKGKVAYHDDDEENLEELLVYLGYNNEDEKWGVDDVDELTEKAIEEHRDVLEDNISYYGDLYSYLNKELGYKHNDIVRYYNTDIDINGFVDEMTNYYNLDYINLFGDGYHEIEFNGKDYIIFKY